MAKPAREPAPPAAQAVPPPKGPWPEDALLRESGFRIHARPKDGPAVWARDYGTYTHAEALRVARRERAEGD